MGVQKSKRKLLSPGYEFGPGVLTAGNLIKSDSNGNLVDAGVSTGGNGTNLATSSGGLTNGDLAQFDSHGNIIDSGVAVTALAPLTQGAAAGLGLPFVAHAIYSFATDGGAVGNITPALNVTIPAGAILVAATINPTTAVLSGGSATVSVGTVAGSSASSILAATGKASFSLDALINGVCTFAAPVKMTASGKIQITVATAALTAGIIEILVFLVLPQNS